MQTNFASPNGQSNRSALRESLWRHKQTLLGRTMKVANQENKVSDISEPDCARRFLTRAEVGVSIIPIRRPTSGGVQINRRRRQLTTPDRSDSVMHTISTRAASAQRTWMSDSMLCAILCAGGALLFLLCPRLAFPQQMNVLEVPGPIEEPCFASNGAGLPASTSSAKALIQKAVEKMDPTGAYGKIKEFSISGSISQIDHRSNESSSVGTFVINEDHRVLDGDFSRTFIVNGTSHVTTRTAGQITSNVSNNTKVTYFPKSYLLPLAVLEDELHNPNITVSSAPTRLELSSHPELASLSRVETINTAPNRLAQYERENWYLDPTTLLPEFVVYEIPTLENPGQCVEEYTRFGSFQNLSGTMVPASIFAYKDGKSTRIFTIQTVTY